jgi:ribonuclease BN (tRNA processing enzyme)
MLEITFVGTGDAFGSGGRRNTSILVRGPEGTLLLDCGPTTPHGLKHLGIDPREIDAIAITHFHGDHIAGVPFLLLDFQFELKREKPLQIIGPESIRQRVEEMTSLFVYDFPEDRRYSLGFAEYDVGQAVHVAGLDVTPMTAVHHPDSRPHMLRIQDANKTLVFSGDTGWHDALPDKVGDAELFISECVFYEEKFEFHLSHERICENRDRFRSDSIILTHLGSEVLDEMNRLQFDVSEDGLRITL